MPISKHNSYESIHFPDPDLPLIFHCDTIHQGSEFIMHWQDSPELLYFIDGTAEVLSDTQRETCHTGEMAFFNCTHLHDIHPLTETCRYYCLIADREFLTAQGLPLGQINAQLVLHDPALSSLFQELIQEFQNREAFYKTAAKSLALMLMTRIYRCFPDDRLLTTPTQDKQIQMVKAAIRFIHENFQSELDIDQISAAAGFSKYYFCRGFRQVTGHTVVEYLNFVRCACARRLLSSGRCNVSEAAEQSGFSSLSYFSKIYRRYMGVLPSQEDKL